jgi:prephenate dehydratase
MKVAIQGVRASFHDVAARKFFKDQKLEIIECPSFPKLFQSLESEEADVAVMAIENALAGSILQNYALLEKFRFKIIGEVFLKIEMCLLALPGESLSDIKVIQSHPMALLQCQEFLNTLPAVKLAQHDDTAESALEIKSKNLKGTASIASRLAAETYGLNILAQNIETNSQNFTRFLILVREKDYTPSVNPTKATLRFETENKPGSLVQILTIFESHSINMTKLQSIPIIGRPYHYGFHVDLEWSDPEKYQKALKELKEKSLNVIHFGEYTNGEKPEL